MKLQTFRGPDVRSCMIEVRTVLGDDAVIVDTTTDPNGDTVLTAALDYDESQARALLGNGTAAAAAAATVKSSTANANTPTPILGAGSFMSTLPADIREQMAGTQAYSAQAAQPAVEVEVRPAGASLIGSLAGATGAGLKAIRDRVLTRRPKAQLPATASAAVDQVASRIAEENRVASTAVREEMMGQLSEMRRLVARGMTHMSDERMRTIPSRARALELLEGYGCASNLAMDIAGEVPADMPLPAVLGQVRERLGAELLLCEQEILSEGGIVLLVGPTGAGKTTTAAKLAARFAAQHAARDVALITIDQHRAAASEQLQVHGRKLGVTVLEANGFAGLPTILQQVSGYPLVIIDTAGLTASGEDSITAITALRASHSLKVLMVMPTNAHPQDLQALARRFADTKPDGVTLTKIDEASRLGSALSVTIRNRLPIAYMANGQAVTTDLAPATAEALVDGLAKVNINEDEQHEEACNAAA